MKKSIFIAALIFSGFCIAETTTITNENLTAAILNLSSAPSIEARDNLYKELNRATYLVPLVDPTSGEGTNTTPVVVQSPKGGKLQAIFSNQQELSSSKLQDITVIEMHATELWKTVRANRNIDGVVLNPARNTLPLNKERISKISVYE